MKLTKAAITALTTEKPDQVFWDDELPGFGVRIRAGKKSWLVQYRIGQQQRRNSLGDIRRVSLEDARKIARQRFAQIELGEDPAADKAEARAAAAKAVLTLGAVVDVTWIRAQASSARAHTRDHPVFPDPVGAFRGRPMVRSRARMLPPSFRSSSRRAAALRPRAPHLSAMYTWAMGEALCDANPVTGTNDPGDDLKARDRVLSDGELKLVWDVAGDDDFGRIVKLLILTGARRQEIGSAKWSDAAERGRMCSRAP